MDHLAETTANFIAAMGMAATAVSVVTTDGPAGRFGLTVSAFSSVSADPPMVLACVNRKSPAVAAIDSNGLFAVNVLAADNRGVAETFAGRPQAASPSTSSATTGRRAPRASRFWAMPPPLSNVKLTIP